MPAHTPREVHMLFAEAFAAGNLEALMSLYEADAAFVSRPAGVVNGRAAIREALGSFLAMKPQFALQIGKVIQSNDLALLISKWTLSATDPDGNKIESSGQTTDVVRRQLDDTWLLAIDNPYGVE